MKKIIYIFLLLISFFLLSSFNKVNFIINKNHLTYSIYEKNKLNYPNFLNEQKIYKSIKYPIYLVNKNFYLDNEFIPYDLEIIKTEYIERDYDMLINKKANEMLYLLNNALENKFIVFSSYRSYNKQKTLYYQNNDLLTAKPGFSEHQTGLAVDLSTRDIGLTYELEHSLLYKELNNICYKYGFILRYPKNKEHITGYPFEPWHYRYVGKEIATIIHNENITLEEYFYKYVLLSY